MLSVIELGQSLHRTRITTCRCSTLAGLLRDAAGMARLQAWRHHWPTREQCADDVRCMGGWRAALATSAECRLCHWADGPCSRLVPGLPHVILLIE